MNLDAEYGVIGSILLDPKCLDDVRNEINADDLTLSESRKIFLACCDYQDRNQEYDCMIIANLPGMNTRFIGELLDITPTAAHAVRYARQVHNHSVARGFAEVSAMLAEATSDDDLVETGSRAIEQIEQLLQRSTSQVISSSDSLLLYYDWLQARVNGTTGTLSTGIPMLDEFLSGGLEKGGLYILGARPGVGKSLTGMLVADHIARTHNVLYVTMEMPSEQLNARRIANCTGMPIAAAMGKFDLDSEDHWSAIGMAASELTEHKLFFNLSADCTVHDIRMMARMCRAEAIVIDYLGLISTDSRFTSLYEKTTWISAQLKKLALALQVPVLAMSQLNRNSAKTVPSLSDLRDSGAIEQDADTVLLLHRPAQNMPIKREAFQELDIIIAKNRNGATGKVVLEWNGATGRMRNASGDWKSWEMQVLPAAFPRE